MRIKPRTDKEYVGFMVLKCRQPFCFYSGSELVARCVFLERHVENMWISEIEIPVGVEVFLKTGAHQDLWSVFEYVDRTVAVVDIKIDDSNATDTFVL